MGIGGWASEYGVPVGAVALAIVALLALFAVLGRLGIAAGVWRAIRGQWLATVGLSVLLLFATLLATIFAKGQETGQLHKYALHIVASPTNLLANGELETTSASSVQGVTGWTPLTGTIAPIAVGDAGVRLEPGAVLASSMVRVQAGATYRYSLAVPPSETGTAIAQVRLLWLSGTLDLDNPVDWSDSLPRRIDYAQVPRSGEFVDGEHAAPAGATHMRLELRNLGSDSLQVVKVILWVDGAQVEAHPDGRQGAVAFSFDWESAMGGAIHSKGMLKHDVGAAAEHGLDMRQGADWLDDLFARNHISATFYGTGYNLLDGNTERRTFSGNPTYEWASRENRWETDYWTEHPWYGDDPYGTYQTHPAWYFGDQTRRLLAAGHEIASHTFGHMYVRGSDVPSMTVDTDEWLSAAQAMGVPPPTTFAFPWRSSNSLKADMYDMLYNKGIRAVTRIYALDMVDQYTVGAVKVYPTMWVMPDFLLGGASSTAGEEADGATIDADRGVQVIAEVLARRGTTSFWTHPEQLADGPAFATDRQSWQRVVEAAAHERDRGRLWIDTVASIIAYERGVMSVTTRLEQGFLGIGGRQLKVDNGSGLELKGVTLTLPGDVRSASSDGVAVRTVQVAEDGAVRLSEPGKPTFPARQLVIDTRPPGVTTIAIEW
ncbi:MAG TPA: polysaccharide deacetylase family protein, partial [Chloroflexia bacterium]|nr:polysaccharide deacetylase family protein [Chloroflexia bacterium]